MMKDVLKKVMASSWIIQDNMGLGRSFSLRKAWQNYKLQKSMRDSVVRFSYLKVNGGVREARGTTSGMYVPSLGTYAPSDNENLKVVTYYDMDKNGWRSFRRENLVSINN